MKRLLVKRCILITIFLTIHMVKPVFSITYKGEKEFREFKKHVEAVYLKGKSLDKLTVFERATALGRTLRHQAQKAPSFDAVIETHFILMEGIKNALAGMAKEYKPEFIRETHKVLVKNLYFSMSRPAEKKGDIPLILDQMTRARFGMVDKKMEVWRMVSQLKRAMTDFSKDPKSKHYYFSREKRLLGGARLVRDPKTNIALTAREWELLSHSQNMKILNLSINKSSYGYAFTVTAAKAGKTITYNIVWGWQQGKWLILKIENVSRK